MSIALTARQQQVLDCIRASQMETGMAPTRAEIAERMGFQSKNAASDHLRALAREEEDRGRLHLVELGREVHVERELADLAVLGQHLENLRAVAPRYRKPPVKWSKEEDDQLRFHHTSGYWG